MATVTKQLVTPVGDLMWVFIDGKGKKDLNDNDRYVASLRFPDGGVIHKSLEAELRAFWTEHKPKGKGKPKSNGLKPELGKEVDAEGEKIPTGQVMFNMWTGIAFPDGTQKVIKIYNSKGTEVSLGKKKIGNGSRGSLSGQMAIYINGANVGVTVYLSGIQITKFVEFKQDDGFKTQADTEGGFDGVENEDGFTGTEDEDVPHQATPETPKVAL